jgi:hypothetical protein
MTAALVSLRREVAGRAGRSWRGHQFPDACIAFEDDGFGWPQRDGLKWPHFVLVDVLVR